MTDAERLQELITLTKEVAVALLRLNKRMTALELRLVEISRR